MNIEKEYQKLIKNIQNLIGKYAFTAIIIIYILIVIFYHNDLNKVENIISFFGGLGTLLMAYFSFITIIKQNKDRERPQVIELISRELTPFKNLVSFHINKEGIQKPSEKLLYLLNNEIYNYNWETKKIFCYGNEKYNITPYQEKFIYDKTEEYKKDIENYNNSVNKLTETLKKIWEILKNDSELREIVISAQQNNSDWKNNGLHTPDTEEIIKWFASYIFNKKRIRDYGPNLYYSKYEELETKSNPFAKIKDKHKKYFEEINIITNELKKNSEKLIKTNEKIINNLKDEYNITTEEIEQKNSYNF